MEEVLGLVESKLGVDTSGLNCVTHLKALGLRVFSNDLNKSESESLIKICLEQGFEFLVNSNIREFIYQGEKYSGFSSFIWKNKIISFYLFRDIIKGELTVEECISKNINHPDFFNLITVYIGENKLKGFRQISKHLRIHPHRVSMMFRSGATLEDLGVESDNMKEKRVRRAVLDKLYKDYSTSRDVVKHMIKSLGMSYSELIENIDSYSFRYKDKLYLTTAGVQNEIGINSHLLEKDYMYAVYMQDFEERSKFMEERINFYIQAFNYNGKLYKNLEDLSIVVGECENNLSILFKGTFSAEEVHNLLDELKRINNLPKQEDYSVELREDLKGLSRNELKRKSNFMPPVVFYDKYNLSNCNLYSFAKSNYKLDFYQYMLMSDELCTYYKGIKIVHPNQITNLLGIRGRTLNKIFLNNVVYHNSDSELFEREVKYLYDVLNYNGTIYRNIKSLSDSMNDIVKAKGVYTLIKLKVPAQKIHEAITSDIA